MTDTAPGSGGPDGGGGGRGLGPVEKGGVGCGAAPGQTLFRLCRAACVCLSVSTCTWVCGRVRALLLLFPPDRSPLRRAEALSASPSRQTCFFWAALWRLPLLGGRGGGVAATWRCSGKGSRGNVRGFARTLPAPASDEGQDLHIASRFSKCPAGMCSSPRATEKKTAGVSSPLLQTGKWCQSSNRNSPLAPSHSFRSRAAPLAPV